METNQKTGILLLLLAIFYSVDAAQLVDVEADAAQLADVEAHLDIAHLGRADLNSLLLRAVVSGNLNLVSLLLECDADSNVSTPYGMTPVHLAVRNIVTLKKDIEINMQIIDLLLRRGAKVSVATVRASDGGCCETPLHTAIRNEKELAEAVILRVVGGLLSALDAEELAKAVNAVNSNDGMTPLHCAASSRSCGLIRLLLSKGARKDVLVKGKTPYELLDASIDSQVNNANGTPKAFYHEVLQRLKNT